MVEALPRLPGWRARFSSYIARSSGTPFDWGTHDCALNVAGGVYALTGVDFAKPFRGRYSTALGAGRALKRYGAGSLEETIAAALPELLGTRKPEVGDVALFEQPSGLTGGFYVAGGIIALTEASGFRIFAPDLAVRAFRVGEL
jgi:hypothetical protein